MTRLVVFETTSMHTNLLPLTFTRPVGALRLGIQTLAEKWEAFTSLQSTFLPVEFLRRKFTSQFDESDSLYVAGNVVANAMLGEAVSALEPGESLVDGDGEMIAFRGSKEQFDVLSESKPDNARVFEGEVDRVVYTFHLSRMNGKAIVEDFKRLTRGRKSQPLEESSRVIGPMRLDDGTPALFIEEGARIEATTINLRKGPVYIGRDAEIMEGSCMRGPLAVCESAHVNMGAKVYGDTTIGPHCKVGGEVVKLMMQGYSNKSHDGFLGDAVVGEWCNIGAGVNASNLKNDYSKIRVWNYATRSFMRTDLQFCGLIMGDHSKIGINSMLNTATVMGVGVNLHGCGFPRTFLPGFEEGSPTAGFTPVEMKKFVQIAERVMARRDKVLTPEDIEIFEYIRAYETSK